MDAAQDPASLQNLNDIVLPAAVGWWPLAPGWWVLLVLVVAIGLWGAWREWLRHRTNRYRREALSELKSLRAEASSPDLPGNIGALLKRTALAVLPREQIAAMSGPDWHSKLDELVGRQLFTGETGQLLDRASYSVGSHRLSADETKQLLDATESWLRLHAAVPE